MIANDIILRPIITEKSMRDAQKNTYSFVVAPHATKKEIKNAVEKLFSVNVTKVATHVLKGGSIRSGMKRIEVKNQPVKKAFVGVKAGQKISAFEVGA